MELKREIERQEEAHRAIEEEIEEIRSGRWTEELIIPEPELKSENSTENSTDVSSASVVVERKGRHEEVSGLGVENAGPKAEESMVAVEASSDQAPESQEKVEKSVKKQNVKKNTRSIVKKEIDVLQTENTGEISPKPPSTPESTSLKRFQSMILPLWMSLSQHKHGTVFMGPVSDKDAPGYSSLIHFPTDMKSIRNKIRDGKITTSKQFHREVLLLFANAIMYNGENSTIAQWAKEGFDYSEEMINMFIETELVVGVGKEGEETPKLKRKKA